MEIEAMELPCLKKILKQKWVFRFKAINL